MFQDFSSSSEPSQGVERVAGLRKRLAARGIQALFVPRSDEHLGEYVPPCAERLKWVTGFTGSAGLAVIGMKEAALFVDGRYVLQAATQIDKATFEVLQVPEHEPADWLGSKLRRGAVVGFDPWLHSSAWSSGPRSCSKRRASS